MKTHDLSLMLADDNLRITVSATKRGAALTAGVVAVLLLALIAPLLLSSAANPVVLFSLALLGAAAIGMRKGSENETLVLSRHNLATDTYVGFPGPRRRASVDISSAKMVLYSRDLFGIHRAYVQLETHAGLQILLLHLTAEQLAEALTAIAKFLEIPCQETTVGTLLKLMSTDASTVP